MNKHEVRAVLSTSEPLLWILCGDHLRSRTGGAGVERQAGCSLQGRKYHAFFIFSKNILVKRTVCCLLWRGVGGRGKESVPFSSCSAINPGLGSGTYWPYFHMVLSEYPKAGTDGDSRVPISRSSPQAAILIFDSIGKRVTSWPRVPDRQDRPVTLTCRGLTGITGARSGGLRRRGDRSGLQPPTRSFPGSRLQHPGPRVGRQLPVTCPVAGSTVVGPA